MEFKLTIDNNEVGMLFSIFNIDFKGIHYKPIELLEDSTVFMVKSETEDYDIMEMLMERLSSVKIEEQILCNPVKIQKVFVFKNGVCVVIDEDGNQIAELQGLWKNKYKDIIIQVNEDTVFVDERVAK